MNDNALIIFGLVIASIILLGFVMIFFSISEQEEVREISEINETISINAKCSGTAYAKENCLLIIENQYKIIKLLEELK